MLAAVGEYFQIWQVPIILLLVFGWIFGGGYLFQVMLVRKTGNRRIKLGHGILVSLLSGMAGVIASFALISLGRALFPIKPGDFPIPVVGIVFSIIGFLVVAYLVVFAMHQLSATRTIAVCLPSIAGIFLLAAILLPITGYFTYQKVRDTRRQKAKIEATSEHFQMIYKALMQHGPSKPPVSLTDLVQEKLLPKGALISPANPSGRGFFYYPSRLAIQRDEDKKLLACDYRENFGGQGRTVLYTDGDKQFLEPSAFQAALGDSWNADFAKALQEAESKTSSP
jgi:hypothetical protein